MTTKTAYQELLELAKITEATNKKVASRILAFFRYTYLAFVVICIINSRWDYLALSTFFIFYGSCIGDCIFIKCTGLLPVTFIDIMKDKGATTKLVVFFIDQFNRNPLLSRRLEKETTENNDNST